MVVGDFDLSDAGPIDGLEAILDVAVDVVRDYAPGPGHTRIERLARYVLYTLGNVAPSESRSEGLRYSAALLLLAAEEGD